MIGLTELIIILAVLIFLFFLLREVNCWYWKINIRIELLEENNRLLKVIAGVNDTNIIKTKTSNENDTSLLTSEDTVITLVNSFSNNKVLFADGIQGEVLKDRDHKLFIVYRDRRYYYNNEQNAIKAAYILKTKGKISSDGLS